MTRILAVDDEKDILFTLVAIGEVAGFTIITVDTGNEALKILSEGPFDLVMVDYHMPTMNGLKLVKEIRKINAQVPILVLTVDQSVELSRDFLANGASDFAIKPVKAADLISRIKLHLKLSKYQEITPDNIFPLNNVPKGLSASTLKIILDFLTRSEQALSLNEISTITGLAYQTVHRYLDFLFQEEYVKMEMDYGKIGRPIHKYKLKKFFPGNRNN